MRGMRSGEVQAQAEAMTDQELRPRLERALARRDAAAPSSPEWDAAMDEIDALSAQARRTILAQHDGGVPVPA